MKNININIPFLSRVSGKERVFFARQLAVMISAGLTIDNAINLVSNQTRNQTFRKILYQIYRDVQSGEALSEALAKHPKVFDRVFISVVHSGEVSGKLDKVLTHLADRMESMANFKGKVRSALAYPIFIVFAMILVVAVMMIKVIPVLKTVFDDSNVQLPWTTRLIIGLSDFMVSYWWLMLIAILVIVVICWIIFTKTKKGRYAWDFLRLKTPGMTFLSYDLYMANFARTFGMLIASGIPIIETIKITGNSMNNRVYIRILKNVIVQVEKGIPISVPLEQSKEFPIIVSQMLMVGEQTGRMETLVNKLADYYENQVDTKVKTIANLIEPITIVIVGAGVGFLVYSILYPIYNLVQVF